MDSSLEPLLDGEIQVSTDQNLMTRTVGGHLIHERSAMIILGKGPP